MFPELRITFRFRKLHTRHKLTLIDLGFEDNLIAYYRYNPVLNLGQHRPGKTGQYDAGCRENRKKYFFHNHPFLLKGIAPPCMNRFKIYTGHADDPENIEQYLTS
jgi:hypothetical protein